MKLPHFDYEAPDTVADAVGLLSEHLEEASVLAVGALQPAHPTRLALRSSRPRQELTRQAS
jgi:CO/xanthine dehydrogenase FAD-binding subunit